MEQLMMNAMKVVTGIFSVTAIIAAIGFLSKQWAEALFKHRELLLKAELDKQLKLTDRYSSGVEHLGSSNAAVRIGGIYQLGQLLQIDPDDEFYWPVLDLLTSYIRLNVTSAVGNNWQPANKIYSKVHRPDHR